MITSILIGLALAPVYFVVFMAVASVILFIDGEIKAYIKERNEQ